MSENAPTEISLKGLTDDEKRERTRIQQREYMAKRRKEDPEFAKNQRELCNNRKKVLREDKEYLEKEREHFQNYQRNMKKDVLRNEGIIEGLKYRREKHDYFSNA